MLAAELTRCSWIPGLTYLGTLCLLVHTGPPRESTNQSITCWVLGAVSAQMCAYQERARSCSVGLLFMHGAAAWEARLGVASQMFLSAAMSL